MMSPHTALNKYLRYMCEFYSSTHKSWHFCCLWMGQKEVFSTLQKSVYSTTRHNLPDKKIICYLYFDNTKVSPSSLNIFCLSWTQNLYLGLHISFLAKSAFLMVLYCLLKLIFASLMQTMWKSIVLLLCMEQKWKVFHLLSSLSSALCCCVFFSPLCCFPFHIPSIFYAVCSL